MVAPSMASSLGRTLPHSLEAEEYLLSSCLLDGNSVITASLLAKISPESFYDTKHGIVFSELLELYSANKPIDVSVVAEQLKAKRQLDQVGGYAFLSQVSSKITTTAQAAYFIEKVKEMATLRTAIRELTSGVEDCYGYSGNLDEFLASLESRIDRVSSQSTGDSEETVQDAAEALLADLNLPKSERKGIQGLVSWGLPDIDRICGKMAPGDLVVVAAAPSCGKSALALWSSWAAAQTGDASIYFSYEMKKSKLVVRLAQQMSRLNLKQVDDAPMDRKIQFIQAVRKVKECKSLHVFERETTTNRVVARCRAVARREKVGLIVVDYLQELSELEPSLGHERTDEKLSRMAAQLKRLGMDLNCPVMVLSSLNREGYKAGATPGMSSLRNSGAIEFKGDIVAFLHWPETNPRTGEEQDPLDEHRGEFYVEFLQKKGRDNGVYRVPLMFTRAATRFDCLT